MTNSTGGHIRSRGKKSWELKFDLRTDPATGKRQIAYHSFKGTRAEAKAELRRLMTAAENGSRVDPAKTTVAEFFARWECDWAVANVSPKTAERYSELIKTHVRPRIGAARLQKLKPVHLAELYAALLREGRGGDAPTGLAPGQLGTSTDCCIARSVMP
jgi:hypothetical protein